MGGKVTFSKVTLEYHEPPELAEDLRASRRSSTWKADLARYHKLLSPIFTPEHRANILPDLQGEIFLGDF